MLTLRRGLLATGLALSVVGALSAAVGAEAAQVAPAAPETTAPETAALGAAARPAPPALLPWGERPTTIRTGRAGASSDALRAAGLAAADPVPGRPGATDAPKGRPGAITTLADATTSFFYNVGSQTAETDGYYANITVAKPTLGEKDNHTLTELAVQSADSKQAVEVGWTVDRQLNGDVEPHLFVYHWVNGAETCYNGCGFEPADGATVKPGATLAAGSAKRFGIQYTDGVWWVAFDTEFIGYFPEALWTSQGVASFNRTGQVQVFGEVASTTDKPCSQMGNGLRGTDPAAALVGSVTYANGPAVALNVWSSTDYYTVSALSARTFRYGGPGAC